ncbi:MAG: hypothetical protein IT310_00005, partial [Anaerolineales bacterium]|nr:hypothetical protein [Anaerolineales bacterium]
MRLTLRKGATQCQTKPNQTKPNHKRFIRIIAVCLVVIVLYLLPVNTKPEFIAYR